MRISETDRSWALPLFLTDENKARWSVGAAILAAVLYLTSNHLHLSPPQYLPFTWIDESAPFIPLSVWIYISEYVYFIFVYFAIRDNVTLNKYLYSITTLQVVSVAIFWLWPTTYPRMNFPVGPEVDWMTRLTFEILRTADTPANCCPSLHVSSVYLSSLVLLDDEEPGKFRAFFVWGTLIAMSTLTTKQHYFVDVVAGLLMAVTCYWLIHRMARYRPLEETVVGRALA